MSEQASQSWQGSRVSRAGAQSSPGLPQQRRFDESWVEVSSQPSSSSLSSIGDEIVTTGLRVGGPYQRRRRLHPSPRSLPQQQTAIHATGTLSQEEYDESESEDDRLLSSSTENMHPSEEEIEAELDNDSDGDNVTALGLASDQPVFQPQPNAFSHPPTHPHQRSHSVSSPPLQPHPHSGFTRPSFSQRPAARAPPNFMSPTVREENDAALRASLTTLLSCAAAARGLPKSKDEVEAHRAAAGGAGVGPSNQPVEFRLVPESELDTERTRARRAQTPTPSPPRKRSSPARSVSRGEAGGVATERVKHGHGPGSGTGPRATKKKKTAQMQEEALMSPTLLTWVVSAGVVVLVSVVGFGAGYVLGREVGKQEALAASVGSINDTTSCGHEVIRSSGSGLRKIKWGVVGKSMVA